VTPRSCRMMTQSMSATFAQPKMGDLSGGVITVLGYARCALRSGRWNTTRMRFRLRAGRRPRWLPALDFAQLIGNAPAHDNFLIDTTYRPWAAWFPEGWYARLSPGTTLAVTSNALCHDIRAPMDERTRVWRPLSRWIVSMCSSLDDGDCRWTPGPVMGATS